MRRIDTRICEDRARRTMPREEAIAQTSVLRQEGIHYWQRNGSVKKDESAGREVSSATSRVAIVIVWSQEPTRQSQTAVPVEGEESEARDLH